MPRFSANISMLFKELPMPARFAAAAAAGFEAVEIQFPYEWPVEALAAARRAAGAAVELINLPAGDFSTGVRGIAGLPGHEAEFQAGIEACRRYANALGVRKANVIAGLLPAGGDKAACLEILAANLRRAATALAPQGIRVLVEAINDRDMPGFLINTTAEALAMVESVGHADLAVQADLYHMARMGEDHTAALKALGPRLGHVQFADAPGRHEPGTGALDFPALFAAVDAAGYRGYMAAEYNPSNSTTESLGWLTRFRNAA